MTASDFSTDGATELPVAAQAESPEERRRRRKIIALLILLASLIGLIGLAIWYLLFRQPVPIPGIPQTQVPHFNVAFDGLERPMGVAVTPTGDRMYVSQTENSRVAVVLDGSGNKLSEMLPPVSTGSEHTPVYVARDPVTGEVYVSDRSTGAIYIYDPTGAYQRQFQPAVERPGWAPLGVAFDKAGNLYATDLGTAPQQVVEFDRTGNVLVVFGANDGLSFPNGVAIDDAGYVYVTDSNNGRLLVYDPTGKLSGQVGRGAGEGNLGLPRGVVVDTHGHVFVVDSSGQAVFVFGQLAAGKSQLDYLGSFGSQGSNDGEFSFPNGAAVDGSGRIYVTDSSNGRVQLWNY
jgi:DNA-binding beta-propeller fold protein YncE